MLAALRLSTIEALGCQPEIVDKKADYILVVKENQPSLLDDIKDTCKMLAHISHAPTVEGKSMRAKG